MPQLFLCKFDLSNNSPSPCLNLLDSPTNRAQDHHHKVKKSQPFTPESKPRSSWKSCYVCYVGYIGFRWDCTANTVIMYVILPMPLILFWGSDTSSLLNSSESGWNQF